MQQPITAICISNLKQQIHTPRYGVAGQVIDNKLIAFGGFSKQYHNETVIYDLGKNEVKPIKISAQQPSNRRGHTITKVGDMLYLFGGDSQGTCQNDLFQFSEADQEWKLVEATNAPPVRYGHSAITTKDTLVIFGGKNPQSKQLLDDMWRYKPSKNSWERLQTGNLLRPSARYGACMCVQASGEIILFGGVCQSGRLNDVWRVTCGERTVEYTCLVENSTSQQMPSPRSESAIMPLGDSQFALYGGNDGTQALSDCYVVDYHLKIAFQINDLNLLPRYSAGFCFVGTTEHHQITINQLDKYQHFKYGYQQIQPLNIDTQNTIYDATQFNFLVFCGTNQKYNYADVIQLQFYQLQELSVSKLRQSAIGSQLLQQSQGLTLQQTNGMQQIQQQQMALVESQISGLKTSQSKSDTSVYTGVVQFQQNVITVVDALNQRIKAIEAKMQSNQNQNQINEIMIQNQILENENALLKNKIGNLESVVLRLCLKSNVDFGAYAVGGTEASFINSNTEEMKNSNLSINNDDVEPLDYQAACNEDNQLSITRLEDVLQRFD